MIIVGILKGLIVTAGLILFGTFIYMAMSLARDYKYDYILEKDENGYWHYSPVQRKPGEGVTEEFVKLWHEREKQYKAEMKERRKDFYLHW